MQQSHQWLEWVSAVSEQGLEKVLYYKNLKGDPFSQELYQVIAHVFNHGTYHRGQLINTAAVGSGEIATDQYYCESRKK